MSDEELRAAIGVATTACLALRSDLTNDEIIKVVRSSLDMAAAMNPRGNTVVLNAYANASNTPYQQSLQPIDRLTMMELKQTYLSQPLAVVSSEAC